MRVSDPRDRPAKSGGKRIIVCDPRDVALHKKKASTASPRPARRVTEKENYSSTPQKPGSGSDESSELIADGIAIRRMNLDGKSNAGYSKRGKVPHGSPKMTPKAFQRIQHNDSPQRYYSPQVGRRKTSVDLRANGLRSCASTEMLAVDDDDDATYDTRRRRAVTFSEYVTVCE